jgi:hypothetical protein
VIWPTEHRDGKKQDRRPRHDECVVSELGRRERALAVAVGPLMLVFGDYSSRSGTQSHEDSEYGDRSHWLDITPRYDEREAPDDSGAEDIQESREALRSKYWYEGTQTGQEDTSPH